MNNKKTDKKSDTTKKASNFKHNFAKKTDSEIPDEES